MSYAIYLRKSRKDLELEALGQGETLARHREALLELAAKQDLKIDRIYEEMVSGESIADRPVMQELLDDVCEGAWDGVLVMEVERLARGNTKDQGEVAEAFSLSSTLIVTPSKTYDPNDEFDEEYFEFGLFMSRREYKTIRRRMQRGLMAAIKEGNYVASLPPYGYDIVRINKKERTLRPNDQAKYVELMFHWYVNQRVNPGEIARRLTNMGVPTQTGRPEWNRSTVKDILQNDLYRGKVRWNKRKVSKEKVEGQVKRVRRRSHLSSYLLYEGKHPALVSDELFFKAQELFVGAVPTNANTKIINPLAGILVCKDCGKVMRMQENTGKTINTRARFVHPESQKCRKKSAPCDEVMAAVVSGLKAHITDFTFKQDDSQLKEEKRKKAEIRAQALKEIASLEKKRSSLFEFLEDGTYTRAEFTERREVIAGRIEKLQQTINEMDAEPEVDYTDKIVKFSEVLDSIQDPDQDARKKNQLLRDIIDRIEYDCEDLGRQKGGNINLDIFLR